MVGNVGSPVYDSMACGDYTVKCQQFPSCHTRADMYVTNGLRFAWSGSGRTGRGCRIIPSIDHVV